MTRKDRSLQRRMATESALVAGSITDLHLGNDVCLTFVAHGLLWKFVLFHDMNNANANVYYYHPGAISRHPF